MTNAIIINAINAAINNANNIAKVEQGKQDAIHQWWGELCLAWDAIRALNPVDQETEEREDNLISRCWGQQIASEMLGTDWIELHCDKELWDMEQKDSMLRDLYKRVLKLKTLKDGNSKMQDAYTNLHMAVVRMGKETVYDMNKYVGDRRADDRKNEFVNDHVSVWERSKVMFEYIGECISEWDAQMTEKFIDIVDKKNEISKKEKKQTKKVRNPEGILFNYYIGCGLILHAHMMEVGDPKQQGTSSRRLCWFKDQYDKWDIEAQIIPQEEDELVKFGFDENMDSDEECNDCISSNAYLNGLSMESIIDAKWRLEREAQMDGLTLDEMLVVADEMEHNWL